MDDPRSLPGAIKPPPPRPTEAERDAARPAKVIWPKFERVAWHDGGAE